MWLAISLFLAVAMRVVYLEAWLKRSQCIGSHRRGWTACEIRRRVSMERLPGHVGEYPVPREERIRVNRLLGLAVWHREVSIALPHSASDHLNDVAPVDFDGQFPLWLRIATEAR